MYAAKVYVLVMFVLNKKTVPLIIIKSTKKNNGLIKFEYLPCLYGIYFFIWLVKSLWSLLYNSSLDSCLK